MLSALLCLSLSSYSAASTHQQLTKVQETGPGFPIVMRVIILNTAAPGGLTLEPARTQIVEGNFTSAPAATIPQVGARAYNYGIAIAPDAVSGAVNISFIYAAAGGGAYAAINVFSKSAALPNMFGVQVNSNSRVATITTDSALFGDGATTESTSIITVGPPA